MLCLRTLHASDLHLEVDQREDITRHEEPGDRRLVYVPRRARGEVISAIQRAAGAFALHPWKTEVFTFITTEINNYKAD